MISLVKNLFRRRTAKSANNDFSAFFRDASEAEQKEVLLRVIKKANEEQRKVIQKYNELTKTT